MTFSSGCLLLEGIHKPCVVRLSIAYTADILGSDTRKTTTLHSSFTVVLFQAGFVGLGLEKERQLTD